MLSKNLNIGTVKKKVGFFLKLLEYFNSKHAMAMTVSGDYRTVSIKDSLVIAGLMFIKKMIIMIQFFLKQIP